jgi:carbon-monoxide dehydrogenase medium subunit
MKPAPFAYVRPRTLEEALDALAEDGAIALAGGQSLVPLLNFGDRTPVTLVDINAIPGLEAITPTPDGLTLGGRVRHAQVERSEAVRQRCPLLAAAARFVAHPPVRARGTLGGSLAHGHPCAELAAVVAAAGGQIELRSAAGARTVDHETLARGPFDRALAPGELITAVRLPRLDDAAWGLHEISRRTREYALAGAVVALTVEGDAVVGARVALFGVEGSPRRLDAVERCLAGVALTDAGHVDVATATRTSVLPREQLGGDSPDYRRHLAGVAVERAVAAAAERGTRR